MKKGYLSNGNGIIINIITDGTKGFIETAIPSGQFGFIRTTASVTDIEAECMKLEMIKSGWIFTEEN